MNSPTERQSTRPLAPLASLFTTRYILHFNLLFRFVAWMEQFSLFLRGVSVL